MLTKRSWIPILITLLAVMGCGLFYGVRRNAQQEPVKVYKPVEVQQSRTQKPPPSGETAESGHWHGDEWHAEPHDTHTPAEVATPEAEGAQIAAPTPEELEIMQLSGDALYDALYEELNKLEKGSEAYNELAEKIKWFEKDRELSDRRIQVGEKLGAALEEAARVSETEEQLKREMRLILAEMESEMLEAERLYQEHQKSNPLEQ